MLFKRPQSLRSRKVFATSRYLPASDKGSFLFKAIPSTKPELGIIVTKKTGGAVARNYIKRRLKHAFWSAWESSESRPSCIWILIGRKEAAKINFDKLIGLFSSIFKSSAI